MGGYMEDEKLPGTDQTLAEVAAYQHSGAVDVAFDWVDAILTDDRYEAAYGRCDVDLRTARAQAWLWSIKDVTAPTPEVRDEAVHDLVQNGPHAKLWDHFAESELAEFRHLLSGWDPKKMGFMSRPRPVALDYMLVVLGQGGEYRNVSLARGERALPILVHLTEGRWQVAHPLGDAPVVSGWPPTFPEPTLFKRLA